MEDFSIEKFIQDKEPATRTLKELMPVLRKGPYPELPEETVVYDMYRDVCLNSDQKTIERHGLRFDITVIHPDILANEFTKTHGHYHKDGMLEITEVIKGKAWYLLQKCSDDPRYLKEVYLVYVNEGEKLVYPPGFGHITINPESDKELITSDWISPRAESDYVPYKELQGACYYFYKTERGELFREENKEYIDIPNIVELAPKEIPEMKITFDKPLYSIIKTPGKLDFLNRPEKYREIFTIDNCYTRI